MRRHKAITESAGGKLEIRNPSSHGPCPFTAIQIYPIDGIWPDRNVNGMTTWSWFNELVAVLAKSSRKIGDPNLFGQMALLVTLPRKKVSAFKRELILVTGKSDRKFSATLHRGVVIPGLKKALETVLITTHRSTKDDLDAYDNWDQRTEDNTIDFDERHPGVRHAKKVIAKERRREIRAKHAKH